MIQDELPTDLKPYYRVLDAESLEELEDKVTKFMQDHDDEEWYFLHGPHHILYDDGIIDWFQTVYILARK